MLSAEAAGIGFVNLRTNLSELYVYLVSQRRSNIDFVGCFVVNRRRFHNVIRRYHLFPWAGFTAFRGVFFTIAAAVVAIVSPLSQVRLVLLFIGDG